MSEELFDVVFFGILQAGKDKETAMQNMAAMFKTDAAKLAPYFAGGRKVIKGKINADTAEKYRAALENIGLVIKLEPYETSQSEQAAPGSDNAGSDNTGSDNAQKTTDAKQGNDANIDTGDLSVAPVGVDVIENPVEVPAQKIDDIGDISMAEVGANVVENPVEVPAQKIEDISDISMAELGSNVVDHPQEVVPQKIDDISEITMAEAGADIIANPKPEEKIPVPDTSELSLDTKPG